MRIGMILDYVRDWPPGIRAEKQSNVFHEAGHEVHVLSPRYNKELAATEFIESAKATVHRVDIPGSSGTYVRNAIRALSLFDHRMVAPIAQFVSDNRLDVLHVHDIWLLKTTLHVAEPLGIPVVADLHENMPAAMVAARAESGMTRRWVSSILWNYRLMRWQEAQMLKRCHHTMVVVEEAAERLHEYGLESDRISVVSNTENERTFDVDPDSADPELMSRYKDWYSVSYVGGGGIHRGLDTVVSAVPRIASRLPSFKLIIVGADPATLDWINQFRAENGVESHIDALGWQPYSRVQSYIKASDVCLVPHNDFEHTQTTVPHKLFQYMICAKPVLVSDCRPLKRIVESADAGFVFRASDPEDFARTVIQMYESRSAFPEYGARGRRAALGPFSWTHDAKRMLDIFESVHAEATGATGRVLPLKSRQ